MGTVHVDIEVEGYVVPCILRPLTPGEWSRLVDQHPSADPRYKWDPDTFEPALVRACMVSPDIDPSTLEQLVDDVDAGGQLVSLAVRMSQPDSLAWARERVAKDDRLALELAVCAQAGISRAAFLEWDVRDQELALAYHESRTRVCPGCGVPEADMKRFDAWTPDGRTCLHCQSLELAEQRIPETARRSTHLHLVRPG